MTRAVIVSPEAEAQIETIDLWWRTNRLASPGLFAQELAEDPRGVGRDQGCGARPHIDRALKERCTPPNKELQLTRRAIAKGTVTQHLTVS